MQRQGLCCLGSTAGAEGGGDKGGDTPRQSRGKPSPGRGCGAVVPRAPRGLRAGLRRGSVLAVLEQRALEPQKRPEAAANGCPIPPAARSPPAAAHAGTGRPLGDGEPPGCWFGLATAVPQLQGGFWRVNLLVEVCDR